jgi:ribosomal protein S18 acetylase RimI-like enzyme
LRAAGYCLRAQREEDHPFLERLYISVRESEVEPLDWPEEAKRTFLADQFRLQTTHYRTHYYDAEFLIVERSGSPVGRLYVFRGPHDHRVIDISLLPETRNAGVGGALLQAVKAEAAADGKTVSIHVEKFNPAQNLYRRLGFREIGESGPYRLMEWRPA